jgi:hypothetical protein
MRWLPLMIDKWLKVTHSTKSPGWKGVGLQAGEEEGVTAFIRNARNIPPEQNYL